MTNAGNTIRLKSWKGDYLCRVNTHGVTSSTDNTSDNTQWTIIFAGANKIHLLSFDNDNLHRPNSTKGVTTWGTGIGNDWTLETSGDDKIKLKSWKGDYLSRPDTDEGVSSSTSEEETLWTIETI